MSQGKPRDPRTEQRWRRWLQLWQRSGLSVRAFCDRHQLAEPSFYAWRRKLQQHAAAPPFVAVQLVSVEAPAPASRFEIVLTNGRTLRVAPGFEAATLRQLLAVLEEVPSC